LYTTRPPFDINVISEPRPERCGRQPFDHAIGPGFARSIRSRADQQRDCIDPYTIRRCRWRRSVLWYTVWYIR